MNSLHKRPNISLRIRSLPPENRNHRSMISAACRMRAQQTLSKTRSTTNSPTSKPYCKRSSSFQHSTSRRIPRPTSARTANSWQVLRLRKAASTAVRLTVRQDCLRASAHLPSLTVRSTRAGGNKARRAASAARSPTTTPSTRETSISTSRAATVSCSTVMAASTRVTLSMG